MLVASGSAISFCMAAHIIAGVPSNSRPQPIANSVSPVKAASRLRRRRRCASAYAPEFPESATRWGPKRPGRAFVDANIDPGDAFAVHAGADDLGAEFVLQRQIAAGMVEMVVGVEDMRQLRTAFGQPGAHRLGLGRIDHGAKARPPRRGSR